MRVMIERDVVWKKVFNGPFELTRASAAQRELPRARI